MLRPRRRIPASPSSARVAAALVVRCSLDLSLSPQIRARVVAVAALDRLPIRAAAERGGAAAPAPENREPVWTVASAGAVRITANGSRYLPDSPRPIACFVRQADGAVRFRSL